MKSITKLPAIILAVVALLSINQFISAQTIPYFAAGNGVYSPINGDYSGAGLGFPIGPHVFFGNVDTTPTDNPLVFLWQSSAPQATVGLLGTIFFDASGVVELIPVDETTFRAVWVGEFVVVGGSGLFSFAQPADKPLTVVAVNAPFTFDDPEWFFNWVVFGRIKLF